MSKVEIDLSGWVTCEEWEEFWGFPYPPSPVQVWLFWCRFEGDHWWTISNKFNSLDCPDPSFDPEALLVRVVSAPAYPMLPSIVCSYLVDIGRDCVVEVVDTYPWKVSVGGRSGVIADKVVRFLVGRCL